MIGKTISHYRILGQIGEGGMGVVYVAEDTNLFGRRVAVKIPHLGKDEQHYRKRFLREAKAVAALTHKNVAAVYDYGETEDGWPYIVMELVTGQTLGDILTGPGLTVARAVEVAEDVADALAEAHRSKIVHRDIKPSNVIITDRGEVKVLDFGLAKQFHQGEGNGNGDNPSLLVTHTRSDVVIGTPLYLSPEQARGAKEIDGRSDLFALGALLYECVAGRPAFSGSTAIEIGAQVLHFDPPPPSRFNPRVGAELDRVILKALAKRAEDRYQTAGEMANDLARVRAKLGGDTTRTRRLVTDANLSRPSALNTIARNLRQPRSVSPLAIIAMLAAVLVGFWAYLYFRAPSVHEPSAEAAAVYERGVDALRDGAYYRAKGLFEEAVGKDGKFALAFARQAEALTELDSVDQARDKLLTVTRLVPDQSALPEQERLYLEGITATVQRDAPSAVRAYAALAKLNPADARAHVDLGRAYENNNETEKAVESYVKAAELDPSYATAYLRLGALYARLKNIAKANSAFDKAQSLFARSSNLEGGAEVHFQRGRFLVELRKGSDAKPELERAVGLAQSARSLHQQLRAELQLSYLQEAQGLETARAALQAAQSNGMDDLTALGHITLGSLHLLAVRLDEAEGHYLSAHKFASDSRMRRSEAYANLQLGSLRERQGRLEDAERHLESARQFYEEGGYRREVASAALLLGRLKRKRLDYEGTLGVFEGLMRQAGQWGDRQLVSQLLSEIGTVLWLQGRLPEALEHYRRALALNESLDDRRNTAYARVNCANMHWQMGRYKEALEDFDLVGKMLGEPQQPAPELVPRLPVAEAQMLLSRRQLPEAEAKAREALALAQAAKSASKQTPIDVNVILCTVRSLSGGRDTQPCKEAMQLADATNDQILIADVRLAVAEALAESGDPQAALEAARHAQEFFARVGRVESEWRALAAAGLAARRAGDNEAARDYFARASQALSRLEQQWGSEAAASYASRPDVQRLRSGLGG